MVARACEGIAEGGARCRARPMREVPYCFWHSPQHTEAAADARRLGGLRRRREGTLAGAYEFEGLGSAEALRRLLEITVYDALALDNSIARVRALTTIVQVGARLLEVSELEERLDRLEEVVGPRLKATRR